MPFIPVPNTVSVELLFTQYDVQTECGLFLEFSAPQSLGELIDLGTRVNTAWEDYLAAVTPGSTDYRGCALRALDTATSPVYEALLGAPVSGMLTAALPNLNTLSLKFSTGLAGRSYRGRVFLPGIPNSNPSIWLGNNVTVAAGAAWVGAWESFLNDCEGIDATHVVVSYVTAGVPRATGVTTAVVGIGFADLMIDTQRKRRD